MTEPRDKPVEILLVEDNDGDVFLTKKAFKDASFKVNITVASDGEIAMEMLRNETGEHITPDIVLLDINLPKKDGRQVLKEVKADENLRRTPVIILTSSKAEEDILKSYDLQASGYIVKPVNIPNFCEVVAAIENFWFRSVVLPTDFNK